MTSEQNCPDNDDHRIYVSFNEGSIRMEGKIFLKQAPFVVITYRALKIFSVVVVVQLAAVKH